MASSLLLGSQFHFYPLRYCAIFLLFSFPFFLFFTLSDSLLYPIHLTVSLFLFKTLSWRVCCISLLISRRRLSMLLSRRISFSRTFFCSIILDGPVNSSAIRRFCVVKKHKRRHNVSEWRSNSENRENEFFNKPSKGKLSRNESKFSFFALSRAIFFLNKFCMASHFFVPLAVWWQWCCRLCISPPVPSTRKSARIRCQSRVWFSESLCNSYSNLCNLVCRALLASS